MPLGWEIRLPTKPERSDIGLGLRNKVKDRVKVRE